MADAALHSQPVAQRGAVGAKSADKVSPVVIIYLLFVMFPLMVNVGPLVMTNLRLLLMVLVIPLFVQIFLKKYGPILITDIAFPLFIVWTFFSLTVNSPHMAIENTGSTGIEFLGGYAVGRAYIRTPQQFFSLCRIMAMLVLLLFPLALAEALTGRSIALEILRAIPGLRTIGDTNIGTRMGLYRVQTGFTHPIHHGLFCSVATPLVFVALKGKLSEGGRWIMTFFVAMTSCLALSSGALLAVVLQIGLIGWAAIFAKVKGRWWILLGLMVSLYLMIDILSNRSPIRVFLHYATFSAHTAYWRVIIFEWGMVNVWANPIFGLGFNDWVRPFWMYSGSMDNFWLVNAVRYGIVGFALLALGYVIPIWKIMRCDFEEESDIWRCRLAWVLTIFCLTFTLCTVHVWHHVFSFVFFVFGAGLWLLYPDSLTLPSKAQGVSAVSETPAREKRGGRRVLTGSAPDPAPTPQDQAPEAPRQTVKSVGRYSRLRKTAAPARKRSNPKSSP